MELIENINFDINALSDLVLSWLLSSGIRIVFILLGMIILLKLAGLFSRKIFSVVQKNKDNIEAVKRTDTLSAIVRYILKVSILVVSALLILGEIGIEIGPILAAAGVLGLAVGFGAQSLVKDVISGFFILLEDQIRVGDVIIIAGKAGLVEKIDLRLSTLRDLEGRVHYVPNGQIDVVTNLTKEFSYYVFDISIAYKEDIDHVIDVIKVVGDELRSDPDFKPDIIGDLEVFGLDKFADSALIVKARIKTKPIKQWGIAREFNRRLKIKFDEENIEIPFPHLKIYTGNEKLVNTAGFKQPAVN